MRTLLFVSYFATWAFIPHLLLLKKRPAATLAWLWAIVFIPWLGALCYFLIGTDRLKRLRLKRRGLFSARISRQRPPDGATDAATTGLLAALPRRDRQFLQLLSRINQLPASSATSLRILCNADEFYPALAQRINEAVHQVQIEFYIWQNDATGARFLALLTAAARRGVSVRLLLDGVGVPGIKTDLEGKQVLVVVRGYHYREDLQVLRPYIREYRPVLVGVDGGADALLEAGYTPALIVGDMDSVSDAALCCGAEIVVHAYRDGRAPGLERVEKLGLPSVVFPAAGTSEDVALLLADDKGASLIVAVGTHATLVEFLDKGRSGMASTFLTRLRVGGKLVDAKGVSRLYRSRISTSSLFVLVLAALLTLGVVIALSPVGQVYMTITGAKWDAFVSWLTRLF